MKTKLLKDRSFLTNRPPTKHEQFAVSEGGFKKAHITFRKTDPIFENN